MRYPNLTTLLPIHGWVKIVERMYGEKVAEVYETKHDDWMRHIRVEEKHYHDVIVPKVRDDIRLFVKDNEKFASDCRERYLAQIMAKKKKELRKIEITLGNRIYKEGYSETEHDKKLLATATKLKRQIDNNGKGDATQEMIEKAELFPIENIVIIKNDFAKCVNHNDKHPSMYCKKNFAHCFSCGWSGNTIQLYRKVHGCGFVEAVKNLQ